MAASDKPTRSIPKRKGGTRYPRYSLSDALPWAKKLVSKTHAGSQTKAVVASGVVDTKGSTSEIRISALKQFGLLDGTSAAYVATDLAKSIANAPKEEASGLIATAALAPAVFKELYNTFQNDSVSKGKLRQRAAGLDVHPDETEKCVDIYIASMVAAKLVTVDGETVTHASLVHSEASVGGEVKPVDEADEVDDDVEDEVGEDTDIVTPPAGQARRGSASVNVTIAIDSSLDTDKLERQLRLLRKFGAL